VIGLERPVLIFLAKGMDEQVSDLIVDLSHKNLLQTFIGEAADATHLFFCAFQVTENADQGRGRQLWHVQNFC
jgi:hypothetical protein